MCEEVNARAEFDRQIADAHQVSTGYIEELGLQEMLVSCLLVLVGIGHLKQPLPPAVQLVQLIGEQEAFSSKAPVL